MLSSDVPELLTSGVLSQNILLQLHFPNMASVSWKFARCSRLLFSNVVNVVNYNVTRNYSRSQPVILRQNISSSLSLVRAFSAGSSLLRSSTNPQSDTKAILEAATKPQEDDEKENQKKREQHWRMTKYGMIVTGTAFGIIGAVLFYELGSPSTDDNGQMIQDEFSHLPIVQQYIRRFLKEVDYLKRMIREPSREKLLPDPLTYPYIQPPYTLVLELTDLLIHPDWTYQTGWRFKKRPGVDYFLEQVAPPLFEVVVYTAEQGMTVFPILDTLDPNGYIMYRLVRDATHFVDGAHVKNLDRLNRDLSKVIVVDWNPESVKLHPKNALLIPRWKGSDSDATLIDLAAFLKTIASNKVEDVRDVLEYYQQFDDPILAFRENQRKVMEQKELNEKELKDKTTLTQRWRPSFLHPRG